MQRKIPKGHFYLNPRRASLALTAPSVEMSQLVQDSWASAICQLAQPSREIHCTGVSTARPDRRFRVGGTGKPKMSTLAHSSVDSAAKQYIVIVMSLRRRFVPTAWLLRGHPLSLSFRLNATLPCNATEPRI